MPSLLQAVEDRELFGFEVWPVQRDMLAAVESAEWDTHIWAVGRRSGKSTLAALVCLHNALFRPDLDAMVRRGETRFAVTVATNLAQARLVLNAARSIVDQSPVIADLVESSTEDAIYFALPSGARTAIRAFPCNARSQRGFPVSCLVLDEFAHFLTDSDGPAVADKVYGALRPSLAQFGDQSRTIIASTPYGLDNAFSRLYHEASDSNLDGARSFHAPSWVVNPTLTEAYLKGERQRDPGNFDQEFGAEFLASGDGFIDLERAEIGGTEVAPPEAGEGWVVGLDPAFAAKGDDFGVAVVGRSKAEKGSLIVGPVKALRPEGDFTGVLAQVADIANYYGATGVTDQFAAEAVINYLRRLGVTVRKHSMSATTKTDVFGELRARLYDRSLGLPNYPPLVAEVRRLQTRFRSGSAGVVNPRVGSSHGDMVQALALAVFEHRLDSGVTRVPYFDRGGGETSIRLGGLTLIGDRHIDEDEQRSAVVEQLGTKGIERANRRRRAELSDLERSGRETWRNRPGF
jgi:hypothetical protein